MSCCSPTTYPPSCPHRTPPPSPMDMGMDIIDIGHNGVYPQAPQSTMGLRCVADICGTGRCSAGPKDLKVTSHAESCKTFRGYVFGLPSSSRNGLLWVQWGCSTASA